MKIKPLIILALSALSLSGCIYNPTCSHADRDHDHLCDSCGKKLSEHIDGDKNHVCDFCRETFSECSDLNHDHICDYCEKEISTCKDENHDHKCDYCYAIISEHEDLNHDGICDVCEEDLSPVPGGHKAPFLGDIEFDGEHIGYEFTKANVSRPTSGTATVEIFGINDFHGAILPSEVGEDGAPEAGLAKMGTFIKSKTSKPNTLFFDQGDTWQGTLESNENRGSLIQNVFEAADLSLRTIGNHDFDWGISALETANSQKFGDYTLPTLAANVFDYDFSTKTVGETQQSSIGKEYATFVMENGIKVGVVGVIGDDQIASIATQLVENICFTDHIEKIKEMSDYLRTTKNCDIVVASVHGDASQTMEYGLTDISEVSNKRYVDLVLNGHSHRNECFEENDVIFTQWGRNGAYAGSVTLTFDFDKNEVLPSNLDTDRTSYNAKYLNTYYKVNDPEIDAMVNNYLESIKGLSSQVLSSKFSGSFASDQELPNLMAEALFEEAVNEGYDLDYSVVNYARDSFSKTTMTYSDLYKCFPFDNEVVLLECKGENAYVTLTKNYACQKEGADLVHRMDIYLIAAVDYLAYHTNKFREYNYFVGANFVGYLCDDNGNHLTYRDILKNYLTSHPEKEFNSSNYSKYNNPKFDVK